MCGIIGKYGRLFTEKDVRLGGEIIRHRGPDEKIFGSVHSYSYGMNRLSIRDLIKGLYPFRYKHYELIFNGEIYNITELKQYLGRHGYKPISNCDAELILPLFDLLGRKAFSMLCGMFAIAIFDKQSNNLTLARDQFGEKPLYYYHQDESIFFSSELKSFPSRIRIIDTTQVSNYLVFGFLPSRNTMYKNINKIFPGECITYNCNKHTIHQHRYFILNPLQNSQNNSITTDKLDITLKQIMKEKVVSDVPVGVFLSGGVDSSLVAALASQIQQVETFSIGFKDEDVDESRYAKLVSRYLRTNHTHITYTAEDIQNNWYDVVHSMDEPISDPALFPTYLLAAEARKKVTVILTGEGADEFFCGYERYRKEYLASLLRNFIPIFPDWLQLLIPYQKIWKTFSKPASHYVPVTYDSMWYINKNNKHTQLNIIKAIWKEFLLETTNSQNTGNSLLQLFDLRYYVAEQLCMKLDKMSMAHSIEPRAPFLDTRLLPWIIQSANDMKIRPQKYQLRIVAERYLPNEIVWRRKHGFSLPLDRWLKHDLLALTKTLEKPHPVLTEHLGSSALNQLVQTFLSGRKDRYSLTIWSLLVLNSWLAKNS